MDQVSTKYKSRQGDISITAYRVVLKMENNEDFPDPPEALEKLKKLQPEYDKALADAMGGDKEMTAIKNEKKALVLELLQILADYVTEISKGDRAMILSSGFDVSDETGNGKKQPPTIEKLIVELGEFSEATTRVKNVKNAIAFVHQYTTEPPTPRTIWASEGTSLGSYTFKGLSSDKRHWFRVVAIGSYGLRSYSPVVTRVIQ